jgi:hypothetical protein
MEPGILPVFRIIWDLEWATVQNSTLSLTRAVYYSERLSREGQQWVISSKT